MKVLVTGGSGFIGSALVRRAVNEGWQVVNLDALSYAAGPGNLASVEQNPNYQFERVDIRDIDEVGRCFRQHEPDAVMHLAAESHVDRSIESPLDFLDVNVRGTGVLLEAARDYWARLPGDRQRAFRFHHVSTDEVYGDLGPDDAPFTHESPYRPSSPYSASKAAADHLVRAWARTYGLPVILSSCSNNYGAFQFPEKLIPTAVLSGLFGRPIPVYGDGRAIRDWLHVDDHVDALMTLVQRGRVGETYMVGGRCERTTIEVVQAVCDALDRHAPANASRRELIKPVQDRPGHDRRYAVDVSKLEDELGWTPKIGFAEGLDQTVRWYLSNEAWWRRIQETVYAGERRGLISA